jgi:hypothetical protein
MRTRFFATLSTVVTLSIASFAQAQDPLDEMYGQAVHSYFRGNIDHAQELLTEIIDAGSQDPRAFIFRGLCQSYGGVDATNPDFERAAQLEIEGKKVVNVGRALERIQGPTRVAIEKARSKARLASRARLLEMQRSRYEDMQRLGNGNAKEGILVPPRLDKAPAPTPFAPNDPFNDGMTKGAPKAMGNDAAKTTDSDAFGTDAPTLDEKPADTIPAPDGDDPFK